MVCLLFLQDYLIVVRYLREIYEMTRRRYVTGNSGTDIEYEDDWLVLDLGSGHNPHPRADILVDRYWVDTGGPAGRAGRQLSIPDGKHLVIADAGALPFVDNQFDFIICSHIAEHVEHIGRFCAELNRVGQRGYIETPSKVAEILRHLPYHVWYVTSRSGGLLFEHTPQGYPLGWFGKFFFSLYFYRSQHVYDKNVFRFAYGAPQPWDLGFLLAQKILQRLWLKLKFLTYTRLIWNQKFSWQVKTIGRDS